MDPATNHQTITNANRNTRHCNQNAAVPTKLGYKVIFGIDDTRIVHFTNKYSPIPVHS
jgi:hypothetical protein